MKFTVKFFATFKDVMKTACITMDLSEPLTVGQFKQLLTQSYSVPEVLLIDAIVSKNRKFAENDEEIHEMDEIAVFPPVSGGNEITSVIEITSQELDVNSLVQRITFPTTGAVCTFTGIVRELNPDDSGGEVIALEYEAYLPMAREKISQIIEEMRNRWDKVEGIAIAQRIGYLPKGIQTIVIACSAAHRDDGIFEAARYGIDRLKEIVPIWKKEITTVGEQWKKGSYMPGKDD